MFDKTIMCNDSYCSIKYWVVTKFSIHFIFNDRIESNFVLDLIGKNLFEDKLIILLAVLVARFCIISLFFYFCSIRSNHKILLINIVMYEYVTMKYQDYTSGHMHNIHIVICLYINIWERESKFLLWVVCKFLVPHLCTFGINRLLYFGVHHIMKTNP